FLRRPLTRPLTHLCQHPLSQQPLTLTLTLKLTLTLATLSRLNLLEAGNGYPLHQQHGHARKVVMKFVRLLGHRESYDRTSPPLQRPAGGKRKTPETDAPRDVRADDSCARVTRVSAQFAKRPANDRRQRSVRV